MRHHRKHNAIARDWDKRVSNEDGTSLHAKDHAVFGDWLVRWGPVCRPELGMAEHFVYLYRDRTGRPMYVGYGHTAQRAISHKGGSHNKELKTWLGREDFDLQIAGPYSSEQEAKVVEAALISSMAPKFNRAPGDGPKFAPVGVPPHLWERPQMKPLTLGQIGRMTGGALLVYLSPGKRLRDGRLKFDAALPDDEIAASNIERSWDLRPLLDRWVERPQSAPKVILGIHGKVSHRFIVGSLLIDTENLGDEAHRLKAKRWPRDRWRVPLLDRTDLDACELRGRRVDDLRFGQFSHQLHIWVDGAGRKRHPK